MTDGETRAAVTSTPRLAPLPVEGYREEVLAALEAGRASLLSDTLQAALDSRDPSVLAGTLPNAITTMLHHPRLAGAWLGYNAALLREPALSPRQRELLILRVAWRTHSRYEWLQHVRMAPRYGIGARDVEAIAGLAEAQWTALESALVSAADQLLDRHTVDQPTWDRLAAELDERQLVELPFIVGTYACLAMAFNCFGIHPDPQYMTVDAPAIPETED